MVDSHGSLHPEGSGNRYDELPSKDNMIYQKDIDTFTVEVITIGSNLIFFDMGLRTATAVITVWLTQNNEVFVDYVIRLALNSKNENQCFFWGGEIEHSDYRVIADYLNCNMVAFKNSVREATEKRMRGIQVRTNRASDVKDIKIY